MSKGDALEFVGVVEEASNGVFKVKTDKGMITAKLSGKIRMNSVRIVVGDKVTVEVSPYDTSTGRITFRHKN